MSMLTRSSVKPAILHKVRQLAPVSDPAGYQSAADLDIEMGSLLLQGYRLMSTHFLGKQKDESRNIEFFGILYIFQLEQSEIEKMRKETVTPEKN